MPAVDRGPAILGWPRLGTWIVGAIALVCALAVGADRVFIALNASGRLLPRFDVTLMPYHDPRFTKRHETLVRMTPRPAIVFTGDSRTVNGIDPESVANAAGLAASEFFNFGTGAQGTTFAREVLLPHLLEAHARPKALAFGVTPDWLLDRAVTRAPVELYRASFAYRAQHRASSGDGVETILTVGLARYLALYRYRADVVAYDLLPALRCFVRDCVVRYGRGHLTRREVERAEAVLTPYGWTPSGWDGLTTGEFAEGRRFTAQDVIDAASLVALIDAVRAAGVTPILVTMPLHKSFITAHEPALSRVMSAYRATVGRRGADLLEIDMPVDDPSLFVDGHHLSVKGAREFSRRLGAALPARLMR